MARLESVLFTPHRAHISEDNLLWSRIGSGKAISNLPQIFWSTGAPWREANLWLMEGACSKQVDFRTVQARATALHAYAKWLEQSKVDWRSFPPRKENRCLVLYRGALVEARDHSELAPSTVSQRMRTTIGFYRWLRTTGLFSPTWPMWTERAIGIRLTNPFGFERTITIGTTDLSIPNRAPPGERLEDGLLPVSAEHRNEILSIARSHCSIELFLILTTGFFTGMRLQTITDLKIETLLNATPDPSLEGLYKIAVGPGAHPPVSTKFGVTGQIWITKSLLDELVEYAHSPRRLLREAKASEENKNNLFLTRFGNQYALRGTDKSAAINVELHALRRISTKTGSLPLRNFKFHQTRCTFATELARLAIRAGGPIHAVAIVKEALLHKHESTSLKYIRFIERTPIKEEMINEFTRSFLGILHPAEEMENASI